MPVAPEPEQDIYFDTVALSNFALVDRLDLLVSRYGRRAQITPEVLGEITDGIVAGYDQLSAIEDATAANSLNSAQPLSAAERLVYRDLLRTLGSGEASCIACAQARGGVVATDDRTARSRCAERGVDFTGTIGILKACCFDKALLPQEADLLLEAMIDAGYYSPVRQISGLL